MTRGELLDLLTVYAKDYHINAAETIARNDHMNNLKGVPVHTDVIDAVLVDFINYIGVKNCIDYALYTSDLTKK